MKVGDKIYCIKPEKARKYNYLDNFPDFTNGKIYNIRTWYKSYLYLLDDNGNFRFLADLREVLNFNNYFYTEKEYRKHKLNNLK